jgi:hypothetical protein
VKEKGVFDVLDSNFLRPKDDPDDIESEGVAGLLKALTSRPWRID